MSGKVSVWTEKRLDALQKILGKHERLQDALPAVAKLIGRRVAPAVVDNALRNSGRGAFGKYLKKPRLEGGEVDLVAEREAKLDAERAKRAQAKVLDELRELRSRQAFIDGISRARLTAKIPTREKGGVREMTAVALASDWHVEERVDPEAVSGRNRYDLDEAARRVERFFQAIAWHVEHQRGSGKVAVRDLVLWLGGDLITGYIHEELLESNALSPTQAVLWLLPRLEGGIRGLLSRLNLASIVVPCSYGNHGRTTPKKRISTGHANSYEWLMYKTLEGRMADESRVRFEVTASAHQYVQVYDRVLHFHHGDSLRYQGGVGGIGIPLLKAVPQWDSEIRADVHCIGHFHQWRDYGRAVVNGSLIGYNAYAQEIRAELEPPQQALFYVDSRRGKTMSTSLWVAEREGAERDAA